MKFRKLNFFATILTAAAAVAFSTVAQASSMVGATDMREARIVSVDSGAGAERAVCEVFPKGAAAEAKAHAAESREHLNAATVSKFRIHSLMPSSEYEYQIKIDGKAVSKGSFKTSPDYEGRTPPPDFSFVVAGNQFTNEKEFDAPFRTNGGGYEIFSEIRKSAPSFVIWADNIDTARNADFGSQSGMNARYLGAIGQPGLSDLLSAQPNYGALGIKTFARSNEDCSASSAPRAIGAFNAFWANPESALKDSAAYSFKYSDAEFFVLDDCSNRSLLDHGKDTPRFLGEKQMKWLKCALQNSTAKFKFIVINSPAANPVNSPAHFKHSRERDELVSFLTEKKISGVIFISANKDYGEVTKLVRAGAYPIYDFTVPPLTGRPAKEAQELNFFRLPSSGIFQRGFAKFTVEGPEDARAVNVSIFGTDGARLFNMALSQSELTGEK